ncbi:MAG: hypothetical protein JO131_07700 [Gammaproteobacteria bacterium]|nr:hypothetical protein [Gammaproteobacteria bacterium]
MSKLRASISFKHRVDEVKAIQQQKTRENIATPIIDSEDNTNLESQERNPENSNNIQDDDSDEENENDETQVSSNWNNLINTWEQLLLQEEEVELKDLDDDYDIEINEILLNRTHSALDNEAKWDIVDIFIDNLDAPFFINENTSN